MKIMTATSSTSPSPRSTTTRTCPRPIQEIRPNPTLNLKAPYPPEKSEQPQINPLNDNIKDAAVKPKRTAKRTSENLIIETVNATGWASLKDRILSSDADVIMAQEHHCLEESIAEKSAMLKKQGWKSFWAPAIATNKDNVLDPRATSGGVAILVRDHLGAVNTFKDEPPDFEEGRAVSATVIAPGIGPIVFYSIYLVCGTGLHLDNVNILGKLKAHTVRHQMEWIAGADWNMEADTLLQSGLAKELNCRALISSIEACVSPACVRTIDFFLASAALAATMQPPNTVLDAATRPHRPVQGEVDAKMKSATKTVFKPNKKLPIDPVNGPSRKPPPYVVPRLLIKEATEALDNGKTEEGLRLYDEAFSSWATRAEQEVADASDKRNPRSDGRASKPARIKVPLVPQLRKGGDTTSSLNAASNLVQLAQELAAGLLKAWKSGGEAWNKLESVAARTCATAINADDPDVRNSNEELKNICVDCKLIARRAKKGRMRLHGYGRCREGLPGPGSQSGYDAQGLHRHPPGDQAESGS